MTVELTTKAELQKFKEEFFSELKDTLSGIRTTSPDDYLTADEVKSILGISSKQFQLLRKRKQITHYMVGRKIYVKRSDLDHFLEEYRISSIYK